MTIHMHLDTEKLTNICLRISPGQSVIGSFEDLDSASLEVSRVL